MPPAPCPVSRIYSFCLIAFIGNLTRVSLTHAIVHRVFFYGHFISKIKNLQAVKFLDSFKNYNKPN